MNKKEIRGIKSEDERIDKGKTKKNKKNCDKMMKEKGRKKSEKSTLPIPSEAVTDRITGHHRAPFRILPSIKDDNT